MKLFEIIPFEEYNPEIKYIVTSTSVIPSWYKKIKPTVESIKTFLLPEKPSDTNSTIKKCVPFLDAMSSGYMVVLSSDIEVCKDENNYPSILWRVTKDLVTLHNETSWDGTEIGNEFHQAAFKWMSQFSFKTPKQYSCLFTHPLNRTDLPFYTLSGIVDTDVYPLPIHFPFLLKKDFTGIIEAGTPIAQIIPIKRDSWNHKFKKYDSKYSENKYFVFFSKIVRSYKKQFWNRKEYK